MKSEQTLYNTKNTTCYNNTTRIDCLSSLITNQLYTFLCRCYRSKMPLMFIANIDHRMGHKWKEMTPLKYPTPDRPFWVSTYILYQYIKYKIWNSLKRNTILFYYISVYIGTKYYNIILCLIYYYYYSLPI